jgi:ATP-dependent DNA helicase RecG
LSNPPELDSVFDEARRRELLNDVPGSLAASIGAIGQRHPPEEVRDLVAALCRLRPWRTEELSDLLRRRPETIRQHYLRPLMRDGRLVMTNPDEPNDPQQAYRAVGATP